MMTVIQELIELLTPCRKCSNILMEEKVQLESQQFTERKVQSLWLVLVLIISGVAAAEIEVLFYL